MSEVTAAAPAPAGQPPSASRSATDWLRILIRYPEAGITAVAIVIAIVFELLNGAFLTSEVPVLLASTAQYGLIAVGEALLMITGEIDLSAAKIYSTTPFFAFYLMQAGVPWPAAIVLALIGAGGIGWLNGLITVRLGVPSLIATLGMLFFLNGAILTVSHSQPARTPDSFINVWLGSGQQDAGAGVAQIAPFLWLIVHRACVYRGAAPHALRAAYDRGRQQFARRTRTGHPHPAHQNSQLRHHGGAGRIRRHCRVVRERIDRSVGR